MRDPSRRALLRVTTLAGLPRLIGADRRRFPNLVFIIADQHSGLALGCAGHPVARTPRLDALARQGVLFTHACTAGITCGPSRASLDTGLHAQAHGVARNGIPLSKDATSIYTVLKESGYSAPAEHTHSDRKEYLQWLTSLGYGEVTDPIIGPKDKAKLIPMPYRFEVGRAGMSKAHSLDAFSLQSAIRFLEQPKSDSQAFGLWVQLHGSHDPYVVPAPYDTMYRPASLPMPPYKRGEYDSKPARQKRTWQAQGADKLSDEQIKTILAHYFGMISQTDSLVGELLDKLSEFGLDQNTVVIYAGDHGDTMGYHRMFTKGFALYEPAVRIPLIIRAPGDLPRGVRIDAAVSGVDVLPTVLDLLGLPPLKGLHGRSLVPLWDGRERFGSEEVFAGQGDDKTDRIVMIRTPRWKLVRYAEGGQELYNLETDPAELDNLAAEPKYADAARRLSRRLDDWDRACKNQLENRS